MIDVSEQRPAPSPDQQRADALPAESELIRALVTQNLLELFALHR